MGYSVKGGPSFGTAAELYAYLNQQNLTPAAPEGSWSTYTGANGVSQEQWDSVVNRVNTMLQGRSGPVQIGQGNQWLGPDATQQQLYDGTQMLAYQQVNPDAYPDPERAKSDWYKGLAGVVGGAALGGAFGLGGAGAAPTVNSLSSGGASSGAAGAAAGAGGAMGNWPIIASSLISGLTGIAGAKAQEGASDDAVGEMRRQFDTARGDAMPYIGAGHDALSRLRAMSGLDGGAPDYSGFENAPGRQFAIQQGERSIDRSLAARGKALSGEGVREGVKFATGMADQGFNTYWNQLAGVAGLGQTTAANNASVGANTAANVGNAQMQGGNARASGYAAANNAAVSGLSNYLLMQKLAKAA
jgi:hypothetical protein